MNILIPKTLAKGFFICYNREKKGMIKMFTECEKVWIEKNGKEREVFIKLEYSIDGNDILVFTSNGIVFEKSGTPQMIFDGTATISLGYFTYYTNWRSITKVSGLILSDYEAQVSTDDAILKELLEIKRGSQYFKESFLYFKMRENKKEADEEKQEIEKTNQLWNNLLK